MIQTDAAPHSPEGTASSGNPFLFSLPGAGAVDLRPVLTQGANINIIAEHLPTAGPLFCAKHDRWGRPISRPTAIYYRLYRWLRSREKEGILTSQVGVQEAGLGDRPSRWWTASPKGIGLIRQVQSSNHLAKSFAHGGDLVRNPETPKKDAPKWVRIPNRVSPLRIQAIKAALAVRTSADHYMFVRPDPKSLALHPDLVKAEEPIKTAYDSYLKKIDKERIVLVDPLRPEEYLILPYRTRFNDKHRQLSNLDTFEKKFEEAEEYYDSAVFLTLTTDPKMHKTLWHANRHMSVAWNRYVSLLTKRNIIHYKEGIMKAEIPAMKKAGLTDEEIEDYQNSRKYRRYLNDQVKAQDRSWRPRSVCCNEFQGNGLIHSHIMIFGTAWIDVKSQISEDWQRCGQGQMVDVCAVRRTPEGWTWAKERPADAKDDEDAKTYLKKYLNKAIFDHKGFQHYFTINKRFFTASRQMSPAKATPPPPDPSGMDFQPAAVGPQHYDYIRPDVPKWVFGGTCDAGEITSQLDFVAKQCRRKYCRRFDDVTGRFVPPEMCDYQVATAAEDRRFDATQRTPRLPSPFVPASALVGGGPPINFADFM